MKVLCIILILVLAIALVVAMVKMREKRSEAGHLAKENGSLTGERSEGQGDGKVYELGAGPDDKDDKDDNAGSPASQESTDAARNEPQENTDAAMNEQNESMSTVATEPQDGTAAAVTEPQKLETLDGIASGTVVTEDELDTAHMEKYFKSFEIKTTGAVYSRINGRSYRENPDVALRDLRYLKVLHYNFNHEKQVGELIVNKGLADEVLEIFRALYDAEYEIQSMRLVDDYWTGDGETSDTASIDKNNSSAFNYRPVTGGGKLSNHAYGYAIDINPQQNPYVSYRDGKARWEHDNADDYIERDTGLAHVITYDDLAYQLFKKHGFTWGGDWNNPKDYQHFEKKLH